MHIRCRNSLIVRAAMAQADAQVRGARRPAAGGGTCRYAPSLTPKPSRSASGDVLQLQLCGSILFWITKTSAAALHCSGGSGRDARTSSRLPPLRAGQVPQAIGSR